MKPVDQTRYGAPYGNCWVACMASLLELSLDDLREVERAFAEQARIAEDGEGWTWEPILPLIHQHGVTPVFLPAWLVPLGFAMAKGPSPQGLQHSVVVRNGVIAHDPHLDREGLVEIEEYTVLLPIWEDERQ